MELDKTMEIIFPIFFYNISKIFPYYERGQNFLENKRRAKRGIDTEDRCHSLCVRRINVRFLRILVGRNAFLRTRCVCSRVFTVDQSLKARPKCSQAKMAGRSALWFWVVPCCFPPLPCGFLSLITNLVQFQGQNFASRIERLLL